jgi:hypothetical protein
MLPSSVAFSGSPLDSPWRSIPLISSRCILKTPTAPSSINSTRTSAPASSSLTFHRLRLTNGDGRAYNHPCTSLAPSRRCNVPHARKNVGTHDSSVQPGRSVRVCNCCARGRRSCRMGLNVDSHDSSREWMDGWHSVASGREQRMGASSLILMLRCSKSKRRMSEGFSRATCTQYSSSHLRSAKRAMSTRSERIQGNSPLNPSQLTESITNTTGTRTRPSTLVSAMCSSLTPLTPSRIRSSGTKLAQVLWGRRSRYEGS